MNRYDKTLSRLFYDGVPIYVDPAGPDWFVPNIAGDSLLKDDMARQGPDDPAHIVARQRFISLLPKTKPGVYAGRHAHLALSHIEECWLHITDHCNLACRHCLFGCSPKSRRALSFEAISRIVEEAYDAGARTFYLTGGEPMMHPDFARICRIIVEDKPDTALVILTNGMLLTSFSDLFASFEKDRFFLQISIDGPEQAHDNTRGSGSFKTLMGQLSSLRHLECTMTMAMAVHSQNADQMGDLVRLAKDCNILNVHFIWLMTTGNADQDDFVDTERLFSNLKDAAKLADTVGVTIDNIKNIASRVFSPANTRHDMSNAGWRSIAVGPDGMVYPTAALVGQSTAACGHVSKGLVNVWKNSSHLNYLRNLSVKESKTYLHDPMTFIIGGGDIDHCFYASGNYIDGDPYLPLYHKLALWLIHREVHRETDPCEYPRILLKMGDIISKCRMDGEGVALTRSNCVLTNSDVNPKTVAADFYNSAAQNVNSEIANPVCYPESVMHHVPESARIRSYGCGSPVLDACIQNGETIVDLGSGAGMECFVAAKLAGRKGRIFGIDMSDPMIELAENLKTSVTENLGYDNIRFLKGLLENIPLPDCSVDVVISNCVINLSGNKRATFLEIKRILKPGGRIMISDVVTDIPVPPHIAGDDKLRGECLAGAMVQQYLLSMLESVGFIDIRLEKRFFYREAGGHRFYSLTYSAEKPGQGAIVPMVYPGPFAAVITDDGHVLQRGQAYKIRKMGGSGSLRPIIIPGEDGSYTDPVENPCSCALPPSPSAESAYIKAPGASILKHASGCSLCGKPLAYLDHDVQKTCSFCSKTFAANAVCSDGHFVCGTCHAGGLIETVRHICLNTDQTDMVALAENIRAHPAFPVHGPEHHFMVPGIILATYRNTGGTIADEAIINGIERGRAIPGGTCAFWGFCGAAAGAGIALGIIVGANPLIADKRRIVQQAVGEIIAEIARTEAPRCCRRETLTVLKKTAELSESLLGVNLTAGKINACRQTGINRECITDTCPCIGAVSGQVNKISRQIDNH